VHAQSMRLMVGFRDRYLCEMRGCSVLDVGSRRVGSQDCYRRLFAAYQYTGMDIVSGDNVDVVGYGDLGIYDVVISGQVMEHVTRPWEWLKRLSGLFTRYICIIAPNTWHEHRYPIDTYRYWPDGMRDLFEYAGIAPVEVWAEERDTIGIGTH
jgi:hypothetical protein